MYEWNHKDKYWDWCELGDHFGQILQFETELESLFQASSPQ